MTMLQLSWLKVKIDFTTPAYLPYWMGSAFRGVFGNELRHLICLSTSDCPKCGKSEECLYYFLYERKSSRRGHAPPVRPIIVVPPFFGKEMRFEKEGGIVLDVLLFGEFQHYIPHVILTLTHAGRKGIGSWRHLGHNRFILSRVTCAFSGETVFDGDTIHVKNLKIQDLWEADPVQDDAFIVGFRTPFTGRAFPPGAREFISLIRNRLIRFVNEYGTGAEVPDFTANGKTKVMSSHFHRLQRRSARSDKRVFPSHTGIVRYEYRDLDEAARWLLGIGFITGLGPDSSFGCGFIQRMEDRSTPSTRSINSSEIVNRPT